MSKTYFIESIQNKNEINWNDIPLGFINENGWNSIPKYNCSFQIVFVKKYGFIIKLTANESNPWALYQNDNDPVYLDSCLEAFLMFDDEKYINLETNSLGAKLQCIGKNRSNRCSILDLNISAISENNEDEWSIIIDLPLCKILQMFENLTENDFVEGFSFKGNFYKTGKNPFNGLEHYFMWNKVETPSPDFHQPIFFGNLVII